MLPFLPTILFLCCLYIRVNTVIMCSDCYQCCMRVVGGRMRDAWCVAMKTIYIYIYVYIYKQRSIVVLSLLLSLSLFVFHMFDCICMHEKKREFLSIACWHFICLCLHHSYICRFLPFGLSYRLCTAFLVFFLTIMTERVQKKREFSRLPQ